MPSCNAVESPGAEVRLRQMSHGLHHPPTPPGCWGPSEQPLNTLFSGADTRACSVQGSDSASRLVCKSDSTRETEPEEVVSPIRARDAEGRDQGNDFGVGEKAPRTAWEVETIELGGWLVLWVCSRRLRNVAAGFTCEAGPKEEVWGGHLGIRCSGAVRNRWQPTARSDKIIRNSPESDIVFRSQMRRLRLREAGSLPKFTQLLPPSSEHAHRGIHPAGHPLSLTCLPPLLAELWSTQTSHGGGCSSCHGLVAACVDGQAEGIPPAC